MDDPQSPTPTLSPFLLDTSHFERAYQRLTAAQGASNFETRESIRLSRQFGSTLGSVLEGLVVKGRTFGDTIRSLGLSLSKLAFRAAFKPLEQGFGNVLSSLFSGLSGIGGAAPTLFAKGGVIASPVGFPLGHGVGVAGEAGPEAIMPLARGPDGRLGVAAANGANGINVTFNVTATDVESFRRSETQIAALLARAVGSGQRNL